MESGGSGARSGKALGHYKDLSSEGAWEGFERAWGWVWREEMEKSKGGSWETKEEVTAIIQAWQDGGLNSGSSSGSGEKCSGSG